MLRAVVVLKNEGELKYIGNNDGFFGNRAEKFYIWKEKIIRPMNIFPNFMV